MDGLLSGYQPNTGYDEAFDDDAVPREAYRSVIERFATLSTEDAGKIDAAVAAEFQRQGITFTVYDDDRAPSAPGRWICFPGSSRPRSGCTWSGAWPNG